MLSTSGYFPAFRLRTTFSASSLGIGRLSYELQLRRMFSRSGASTFRNMNPKACCSITTMSALTQRLPLTASGRKQRESGHSPSLLTRLGPLWLLFLIRGSFCKPCPSDLGKGPGCHIDSVLTHGVSACTFPQASRERTGSMFLLLFLFWQSNGRFRSSSTLIIPTLESYSRVHCRWWSCAPTDSACFSV